MKSIISKLDLNNSLSEVIQRYTSHIEYTKSLLLCSGYHTRIMYERSRVQNSVEQQSFSEKLSSELCSYYPWHYRNVYITVIIKGKSEMMDQEHKIGKIFSVRMCSVGEQLREVMSLFTTYYLQQ